MPFDELIGAAALVSRYVVALVFVVAAVPKLADRWSFEHALANYRLLPGAFVPPVARWLPLLELACGLGLLLGVAPTLLAGIAGVLLAVFAVAVAVSLAAGRRFECGCGGSIAPREIGWRLVAVDTLLAGAAFIAAYSDPGTLSLVGQSDSSIAAGDGLALLVLSAVLVLGSLIAGSAVRLRAAADSARGNTLR